MDFTGSQNFELVGGGLTIEALVQPFMKTVVGRLVLQDATKGANLKNTYSWGLDDPDEAAILLLLEEDTKKIGGEITNAKKLGFGNDSASLEDIHKKCDANKVRAWSFFLFTIGEGVVHKSIDQPISSHNSF